MYEMVTSGIRAGLSYIGKRYAVNPSALGQDNYERMCKIPDTSPPIYFSFTIFKLDENNQYGVHKINKCPSLVLQKEMILLLKWCYS